MSNNVIQHLYLTVPIPDGWEDASQVIALGPEKDGFRCNLVFSQEPTKPGETATEFAARQLPQLRAALDGYILVREGEARFGPNSGFLREHTFSMEKADIAQLQFYVILGGRCYTFTFTDLERNLSSSRSTGERMFSRARLTPPLAAAADNDF
jgi:hypothetical protein